jgi:hypothetical protein
MGIVKGKHIDYCTSEECEGCYYESSAASAGYELKPCPFCGGLAEWCHCSDPACAIVICRQCGAETQWGTDAIPSNRSHVLEAFNRRS